MGILPNQEQQASLTLEYKMKQRKTNRILSREHIVHSKHILPTIQRYHQMVNTEIISIIFFAVKDGETLYNQQKQDQELTVAQIMNSL